MSRSILCLSDKFTEKVGSLNAKDNIPHEVEVEMEKIFSAAACLNASFLLPDSEEDISALAAKKPKQKELNNSATAHGYECPLCNKYLKTLSGFRGHTSKQHGRQDLKAYDHRVTNSASTRSEEKSNKVEVKKKKIQMVNAISRNVFLQFHKVRLSKSVTEAYSTLFNSNEFLESDFKNFKQVFILELIDQLLNQQCLHETQKSNIQQSELSDKDQSILFYISGFIIRACSKKCCKLTGEKKGSKMACIDRLRLQSSTSSFITRFSKWTIKNDRGGLIVQCDNFYLLIREFEMVVKKNIPSNICASSFLCKKLQENIMESYMVKYYSEKVFT
ncbi:unnamed protein product [Mytilus edulis]|uniref:C2H2-type domain-containing protein n=1 Tax=Mytilus edulis TaxID=6550 RepID=A0A8S3RG50_MYTED|nr:unnamed protein product [Mytilus edulis]